MKPYLTDTRCYAMFVDEHSRAGVSFHCGWPGACVCPNGGMYCVIHAIEFFCAIRAGKFG